MDKAVQTCVFPEQPAPHRKQADILSENEICHCAVTTFFGVMFDVFNNLTDLKMSSREVNDFRTFLDYPERGKQEDSRKQEGPAAKGETLPRLSGQKRYEFIFENVSFRYPENCRFLHQYQQAVAHGAGKPTVFRLYHPLMDKTVQACVMNT